MTPTPNSPARGVPHKVDKKACVHARDEFPTFKFSEFTPHHVVVRILNDLSRRSKGVVRLTTPNVISELGSAVGSVDLVVDH